MAGPDASLVSPSGGWLKRRTPEGERRFLRSLTVDQMMQTWLGHRPSQ
jgi:hypothetical protein